MAVVGFPGLAEAGELIAKEKAPKLMGDGNRSLRP